MIDRVNSGLLLILSESQEARAHGFTKNHKYDAISKQVGYSQYFWNELVLMGLYLCEQFNK